MTTETPLVGQSDNSGMFGAETYAQIYSTLQSITLLTNPLTHLQEATFAKVICKRPCFTLCRAFLAYEDYYSTLLKIGNDWQYLFNNKLKVGCSICPGDPYSRWQGCESNIVSSVQDIEQNGGTRFSNMIRGKECGLLGICPKYFYVNDDKDVEASTYGIVKIKGLIETCLICKLCSCDCKCDCKCKCDCFQNCCKICKCDCNDYFDACEILNPGKERQYVIQIAKCCIDYFLAGRYCVVKYVIRDLENSIVGRIEGYPSYCDCSYVYKIDLPPQASPEMKLTIINSIFVMDSLGIH